MKKEYRNVTRTKKMIRNTFTELLNEKKDLCKMSVQELCKRADIAKSTFYYHYDDIYAVAEELQDELISALSDVLDDLVATGDREYGAYVNRVITFLKENEEYYTKIICSSRTGLFVDKLKAIFQKKFFEYSKVIPPVQRPQDTRHTKQLHSQCMC